MMRKPTDRKVFPWYVVLVVALPAAHALWAQTAPSPSASSAEKQTASDVSITSTYALGDVTAVNPEKSILSVSTKAGVIAVQLDERTQYLRLAPGETTLEKAEAISLSAIEVGDRVMARGKVAEDKKSVSARQVIVMSKTAIAQKQEREREQWRRRSVAGTVAAINPATKEVTVTVRSREGPRPITLAASGNVDFRRYAPDSVRFADALASSFDALKAGDHLRALGEPNTDGTHFQAEQIVSGSFLMVGGPVIAVNSAASEININNIPTGKPLTVVVNQDSVLRRIPSELVAMLAQRMQSGPPPPGQTQPASGAPERQPWQGRVRAAGGQPNRAGSERLRMEGGDIQDMLERLPPMTLADLRPGDMILVSSTAGASTGRVTAILLAAGIEALLIQSQNMPGQIPGASLGLPGDVLDFEIGLPPN